jgi:aspartate kinase
MDAPLEKIAMELSELGRVDVVKDRAVIAVVGDMLRETPALLSRTFDALGDIDIDMVSMGANDINLSFVLGAQYADLGLKRLHKAFFETASESDIGGIPKGAGT